MSIGKHIRILIGVGLVAVLLGGCEGTDMATVMGIGDANPAETPTPATPKPSPPKPPPPPSPKVELSPPVAALQRNLKFDAVRSMGIAQTYERNVGSAVGTFNNAMTIKPKDRSVQLWLDAIKLAQEKRKLAKMQDDPNGAFLNPGAAAAAAAANGATGSRPVMPGARPGAPAPGAMPTPSQIDPRLVF